MQAIDILLGRHRGEQRLRAGIVVGIVERLHADLEQHLMALAARARDPTLEVGAIGDERIGDRGGKLRQRFGGAVRPDAQALDHDRDARLVGAARLRLDRTRVDLGGARAVGRDLRDQAMARGFKQALVDRGVRLALRSWPPRPVWAQARPGRRHGDFLPLAGRAVDDGDGLRAGRRRLVAVGKRGRRCGGVRLVRGRRGLSAGLGRLREVRVSALTMTIGSPPNGSSTNRIHPATTATQSTEHARDRARHERERNDEAPSSSSGSARAAC